MDEQHSTPRSDIELPERHPKAVPRRREAARVAVLRAAGDLLTDLGFHAMTVSAIAERAGVAKQTIYRRWRSKVSILLDVLEEDLRDGAPWPPRAEDAPAALEHHTTHLIHVFTQSSTGHVLFALIGHALQDPATAATLRGQVLTRQLQYDRARLGDALTSGPVPTLVLNRHDADQLLDLTVGPAFYRAFMTGQPMDPGFVKRLTVAALAPRHDSPCAGVRPFPGPSR